MKFVRATCSSYLVQSAGECPAENFQQVAVEFYPSLVKAVLPTADQWKAARMNANPAMPQVDRRATVSFVRQSVATRSDQALSLVGMHHFRPADQVVSMRA